MKRFFTVFLAVLFVSSTALAADWLREGQTGATTTTVSTGGFVTSDLSTNENSPMLNIKTCENVDILFFKDTDDGGAGATTMNAFSCGLKVDGSGVGPTNSGWNSVGVCWIMENATLDGVSANDLEAIYGIAGIFMYVDVVTDGTGSPLVIVKCNGPRK